MVVLLMVVGVNLEIENSEVLKNEFFSEDEEEEVEKVFLGYKFRYYVVGNLRVN